MELSLSVCGSREGQPEMGVRIAHKRDKKGVVLAERVISPHNLLGTCLKFDLAYWEAKLLVLFSSLLSLAVGP